MKLVRATLFCMAFALGVFIAWSQTPEIYPNIVAHMTCSGLLTGPYEIQAHDISDFVKDETHDIKLVSFGGMVKSGIADDIDGIFINEDDGKTMFPSTDIKNAYSSHVARFLKSLGVANSQNQQNIVINTFRKGNRSIVTYFYLSQTKIIGYAHPVLTGEPDGRKDIFVLKNVLKYSKENNKTIVWAGEQVDLDIGSIAKEMDCLVYRRMDGITIPLPSKVQPLEKNFVPSEATVCNAVPSTKQQLVLGGFPTNRLKDWQEYKGIIDGKTMHFGKKISGLEDLKLEVIEGENDVLFVIAHLNGSELNVGADVVKLETINSWGKSTQTRSNYRVAVLIVCNSGNERYKVGSPFWKKKVDPLSKIFIENGYFDLVIAPDHTILRKETESILDYFMEGKPLLEIQNAFNGWIPYVFRK